MSSGYLALLADSFPDYEIELWLSPDTAVCPQIWTAHYGPKASL
jgi:hypothetical protein